MFCFPCLYCSYGLTLYGKYHTSTSFAQPLMEVPYSLDKVRAKGQKIYKETVYHMLNDN
jgi:hypothetical protein